ncbi:MAG: hypothetical protein QF713_02880 [Dehalococcoidales bacterium]|jgi:hypothetical protein|nr:hypothetical protein [Dehalococcoidales bacterium]MDP7525264.1 hypothetical protein [Dehalococcoidales bacterium]
MSPDKKKSGEKAYRAAQIEGRTSWKVEELWDGGVERGPYGTKESAIRNEEKIATQEGFIDELVLKEAIGETVSHTDAFDKDSEGRWTCVQGCSIEMGNKEIVFSEGMKFTKGTSYMGIDVAEWLDDNPKG